MEASVNAAELLRSPLLSLCSEALGTDPFVSAWLLSEALLSCCRRP